MKDTALRLAELESVFDKFYRAQKGDHVRPGNRPRPRDFRGFIEAMHGTISAANRAIEAARC